MTNQYYLHLTNIRNNSEEWQALLETRLADFLQCGPGVWWKENEFGIEFYACEELPFAPSSPKLHHFRSSSYKQEELYIAGCWRKMMEENTIIPIDIIKFEDEVSGIDLKKVGMIENLKDVNSVYSLYNSNGDAFEIGEDVDDENEEVMDMEEIIITNNDKCVDDNGHNEVDNNENNDVNTASHADEIFVCNYDQLDDNYHTRNKNVHHSNNNKIVRSARTGRSSYRIKKIKMAAKA